MKPFPLLGVLRALCGETLPYLLAAVAAVLFLLVTAIMLRRRRRASAHSRNQCAIEEFDAHRAALEAEFLAAAAATGKPRGLRWTACRLAGSPLFAVDRATGELVAFVAVTVSFEAIEGGGMEDVEAVGNLRAATAVFVHRRGAWTTDGRVVFNLEPTEALARFNDTLAPLPPVTGA